MPSSTDVQNLKINDLKEAQFDTAVQGGVIGANELSVLYDASATVSSTITLLAANWSSNTQTVSASDVTATNTVFVSPAPLSVSDYAAAGVMCTGQAAGTLTFTCDTTPLTDLSVSVVVL